MGFRASLVLFLGLGYSGYDALGSLGSGLNSQLLTDTLPGAGRCLRKRVGGLIGTPNTRDPEQKNPHEAPLGLKKP